MLHDIKLGIIPSLNNLVEFSVQKEFLRGCRRDVHNFFLLLTNLELDKFSKCEFLVFEGKLRILHTKGLFDLVPMVV